MNRRTSAIKGYLGTSKTDQKALAVYNAKSPYQPERMQTELATNLHVYIPCLSDNFGVSVVTPAVTCAHSLRLSKSETECIKLIEGFCRI